MTRSAVPFTSPRLNLILGLPALVLAGALVAPAPAAACGGLFCSSGTQVAVDQSAERILFEVHGDGTVTSTVEIAYTGAPEGFSWVVPVPGVPELGVMPPSALRLLDQATAPQIIPPQIDFNNFGDDDDDLAGDDDDSSDDDDSAGGDPVDVIDLPVVGPFDPVVVSSDDPEALADWLTDNGYLVTDAMRPFIAAYVADGLSFLGLKLAPEAGIQDIAPIRMTYEAAGPMVPLTLTAVSAEPEMGVLVFIASEQQYASSNYTTLEVPQELVMADPRVGTNNYWGLISYLADQAEGRAFFTQFSSATANLTGMMNGVFLGTADEQESRDALAEVVNEHSWITRLYTRISATEMVIDPAFDPVPATASVSNVINLSGREPVPVDFEDLVRVPAPNMWCGEGLSATTDMGWDGCVCDDGYVARNINLPDGTRSVTCQDARFDMLGDLQPNPDAPAVCPAGACGVGGTCMVVGGMPTCSCEDGFAAANIGGRIPSCQLADAVYPRVQILWPEWNPEVLGDDGGGCNQDDLPDGASADDLERGMAGSGCSAGCSTQVSRARRGAVAPTFFASLLLLAAGIGLRRRR